MPVEPIQAAGVIQVHYRLLYQQRLTRKSSADKSIYIKDFRITIFHLPKQIKHGLNKLPRAKRSWEESFLRILYSDPCIQTLPALEISIKICEDAKICELDDYKEQNKIDVYISADTFTEYDNSA